VFTTDFETKFNLGIILFKTGFQGRSRLSFDLTLKFKQKTKRPMMSWPNVHVQLLRLIWVKSNYF